MSFCQEPVAIPRLKRKRDRQTNRRSEREKRKDFPFPGVWINECGLAQKVWTGGLKSSASLTLSVSTGRASDLFVKAKGWNSCVVFLRVLLQCPHNRNLVSLG